MINSFIIQNKIAINTLINSNLYMLRKLGLVKKEAIDPFIKKIALLSGIFLNIIREIIFKVLYLYIIYFCIKLINGKYSINIFTNSFIVLAIFGALINSKILKTSKNKYHLVILLNMDCKKYTILDIISNLVYNFVFQILGFIILSKYLKISFTLNILLNIFMILVKIIAEALNMLYFKLKKDIFLNNTSLYFIILIFLLSLVFITSKLNLFIGIKEILIINMFLVIISIISIIYILKIDEYKTIYKRIINLSSYSNYEDNIIEKNNINKEKYKNIYNYFNILFIKRHKNIITKPIIRQSILLFILGISLIILVFINKQIKIIMGSFIIKYFMFIFLIIYILNKTSLITEIMFKDCDKSLLTYDFYKEEKNIWNIYKQRLLSITKINLLPVVILNIFLIILLKICLNMNILYLILIFLSVISISVFISNHFMVLYYLLQPFDIDSKIKDLRYQVINSVFLILILILVKVKVNLVVITIMTILLSILYIIVSNIIVRKFASKTFRIH